MLDGNPVIIHGDGTSLWTMTHNSDFAKGFIGLINNPHAIGEAFQITNDELLTWNQIYETIAKCLNVKLNAVHIILILYQPIENLNSYRDLTLRWKPLIEDTLSANLFNRTIRD